MLLHTSISTSYWGPILLYTCLLVACIIVPLNALADVSSLYMLINFRLQLSIIVGVIAVVSVEST